MPDVDGAAERAIAWDQVARLYDTYVTATFDLPFFLREVAGAEDVLELMCGTGRVSLPLAEAGVHLTCVDAAPEMLAVLREKLARVPVARDNVRVVQMDVRQLALNQRFDLVLVPFQSFAELVSPDDQREALARIYQHVCDGGRFICTLHNPPVRRQRADGQFRLLSRFPQPEGTLLLWGLATYDTVTHLVEGMQFYEEYDAMGTLRRKSMLDVRFALIEREQFEALATGAGFRVAALYGDYDYAPFEDETSPFMIWVLEK
jgi:SAM-dependent methyltransferase